MVKKDNSDKLWNNTNTGVQMPAISIGAVIKMEMHRQGRTVAWLSRELHCDRRNIYDIFKRRSIDTALLLRLSHLLHTDFFRIYSNTLHEK